MDYCPSIDVDDILDAIGGTSEHIDRNNVTDTSMPVGGNSGVSGVPKKKPPWQTIQCKNCPNKGHATWVSKHCANHDQYLAIKNARPSKARAK